MSRTAISAAGSTSVTGDWSAWLVLKPERGAEKEPDGVACRVGKAPGERYTGCMRHGTARLPSAADRATPVRP